MVQSLITDSGQQPLLKDGNQVNQDNCGCNLQLVVTVAQQHTVWAEDSVNTKLDGHTTRITVS